ncbi:sulfur oxidation c-type cytochrome SoxX [Paralimibaculum aggregatum]|uniref:Sulfur oxidation c-type cytochrome SoxX n=1 Tax=Paralimibaculum aggregatum TaxID=3036245 RepID=A0ABQ6LF75_9RHOB|nr:sulfur oxidation c-type cytochrome SoxX [Limibaculum sp. NKW23]GMG81992.1 sulfur oxidation c-type cytochrome SoxX [Limibaculum sp. NKW23]
MKATGAALAALAALGLAAAAGAETAPDAVQITDGTLAAPLTAEPGDAARGRQLFAGRKQGNCLACHANSDLADEPFHGEVGPPLDGAADRWSEAELRAIVVNSKEVFGDQTIMPAFYRVSGFNRPLGDFAGKPILTAQQVEDVVAYLRTLKE